MKGTLLEISDNGGVDESSSSSRTIIAALCALLVAGLVIGGYLYLRKRHARQTLLAIQAEQTPTVPPKGPPKAQILVDDAIREGDQTVVAGTIKNISNENLIELSVELELIKRKGGPTEKTLVSVKPAELAPQADGHYSLLIRSDDYASVKLVALRSSLSASSLAYSTGPGKKRPSEKVEPKTIIVKRPSSSSGNNGFLNTPDNPSRVP
jgi:hypothetical protein